MSVDKAAKGIVALVREFPTITLERVVRGKHLKFYLTTPQGKKLLTCSISASCPRAEQNNRSLLRSWSK